MTGCLSPKHDMDFQVKQMQVWLMSHGSRQSDSAICSYNSQENKNPCFPFFCGSFTEDNQQSLISQKSHSGKIGHNWKVHFETKIKYNHLQ